MVAPFTSVRNSKPSKVLLSLAHSPAAISALGGELGIISPISQMRTLRSKEENGWRRGISRLFIAINIYGAPTMGRHYARCWEYERECSRLSSRVFQKPGSYIGGLWPLKGLAWTGAPS